MPGRSAAAAERVEVDDDELERRDRRRQRAGARWSVEAPVGQDAAVDPRVERLHPPVEHLGEARDGRDVGHRQPGVAQGAGGPAGRHELEPERGRGPSANGRGRSCPRRTAGPAAGAARPRRPARGPAITCRPSAATLSGARQQQRRPRAAGAGARRPGSAARSVASSSPASDRRRPPARRSGRHRASRRRGGPCSRSPATPWARASRTACPPGNAGRSDGCVFRIRPGERRERRAGPTMRM